MAATVPVQEDIENFKRKPTIPNGRKKKHLSENQPKAKGAKGRSDDIENVPPGKRKQTQPNGKKKSFLENASKGNVDKKVKVSKKEDKKSEVVPEQKLIKEILQPVKTNQKKENFPVCLLYDLEYSLDIIEYLRRLEVIVPRPKPNYMSKQVDLSWTMRRILIDWFADIADEYKFCDESFHLAVNYVDRFLSAISVVRAKFQLLGAAALMVATKMEEYYPPSAKEWSYLTGDLYTSDQILRMERLLLKVLNYVTRPPTVSEFVKRLCAAAGEDATTEHLAMYISDLVLLEGNDYLQHLPSKLAAAAIALAKYQLDSDQVWSSTLKQTSGYSLEELSAVMERQYKTLQDSDTKEQQAIQNRYKKQKYNEVSKIRFKEFHLEDFKKV